MKQTSNVREVVFVLSLGMTRWLEGNLEACEKELAPIPFLRRTYSGQEESKEESCEESCEEASQEGCKEEEEVASVIATGRRSRRLPDNNEKEPPISAALVLRTSVARRGHEAKPTAS